MSDSAHFTTEHVYKMLEKKVYHVHSVRPKDRGVYKSPTYNIFWLVYDRQNNVIKHFFVCKECGVMKKIFLNKEGNSFMKRHPCFEKWVAAANKARPAAVANNASQAEDDLVDEEEEATEEEEMDEHDDEDDKNDDDEDDDEYQEDIASGKEDDSSEVGGSSSACVAKEEHKLTFKEFALLAQSLAEFSELCMNPEYMGVKPFQSTEISALLPKTLRENDW